MVHPVRPPTLQSLSGHARLLTNCTTRNKLRISAKPHTLFCSARLAVIQKECVWFEPVAFSSPRSTENPFRHMTNLPSNQH